MTFINWQRLRRWLKSELALVDTKPDPGEGDYGKGYWDGYGMALQKVYVNYCLTPEEREEVEKTRREMFGE